MAERFEELRFHLVQGPAQRSHFPRIVVMVVILPGRPPGRRVGRRSCLVEQLPTLVSPQAGRRAKCGRPSTGELTAARVMCRRVVTAAPETLFEDLVGMVLACDVSVVPVIDPAGRPQGVVSETDLPAKLEFRGGTDARAGAGGLGGAVAVAARRRGRGPRSSWCRRPSPSRNRSRCARPCAC
ncbi:CBS domain-containing protein [Lentzea atacamensis]|uniref:CBS domain-containing protein n=1 Tax=Lentzea atacamensis TaxID=531938 RepID=UPI000DD3C46E